MFELNFIHISALTTTPFLIECPKSQNGVFAHNQAILYLLLRQYVSTLHTLKNLHELEYGISSILESPQILRKGIFFPLNGWSYLERCRFRMSITVYFNAFMVKQMFDGFYFHKVVLLPCFGGALIYEIPFLTLLRCAF